MALSNWDLVAWDTEGHPCTGTLKCPDGTEVEVYKNWAYVRDPHAHRGPGEQFTAPTVMEFWFGELQYRGLSLLGSRGRQNSIFLVATCEGADSVMKALYGIGAYGYRGGRYMGVEPQTVEAYFKWLKRALKRTCLWRLSTELPAFAPPLRFNQGDTVMASALGVPLPASDPGQAEEPIMSAMLRKTQKEDPNA